MVEVKILYNCGFIVIAIIFLCTTFFIIFPFFSFRLHLFLKWGPKGHFVIVFLLLSCEVLLSQNWTELKIAALSCSLNSIQNHSDKNQRCQETRKPNQVLRKGKKYEENEIQKAIDAIKCGLSVRKAEKKYNIPKSVLSRYIKKNKYEAQKFYCFKCRNWGLLS